MPHFSTIPYYFSKLQLADVLTPFEFESKFNETPNEVQWMFRHFVEPRINPVPSSPTEAADNI